MVGTIFLLRHRELCFRRILTIKFNPIREFEDTPPRFKRDLKFFCQVFHVFLNPGVLIKRESNGGYILSLHCRS